MEGLSKKKKGLTDTDDSVVVARGGGIKGLNGNGKNIKIIHMYFKRI